jgi:hypothetical protein
VQRGEEEEEKEKKREKSNLDPLNRSCTSFARTEANARKVERKSIGRPAPVLHLRTKNEEKRKKRGKEVKTKAE